MINIRTALTTTAAMLVSVAIYAETAWFDGKNPVSVSIPKKTDLVVTTAFDMFSGDMEAVTGLKAVTAKPGNAAIRIVQLDRTSSSERKRLKREGVPVESLDTLTDGFDIRPVDGQILITGSNGRGSAYGLLEMSRMAGVSPWVWWGDVPPSRKETLAIDDDFALTQGASVEYRGVFINDEDWSLRPWSTKTYEPSDTPGIGPQTYRRLFELLMRLRGNMIWPAMHPGTRSFFNTPGAKEIADSCGIAVGSSHCEPILRNNIDEWDLSKRGSFNYRTNRDQVLDYWSERLTEVKNSEGGNLLTIGMRGIHDSSMEGYRTEQEKFDGLQQVINDQQILIGKYLGDPSKQTQVFVPYKEVLQLYEMGLEVPDYVTLMWCEDNYGYMTRLSTPEEQKRSGGGGVYYHLSYWGRPHDYLWLTTTQPGLIYNEMRSAYDHNVRKMWIANVHDPKVAGYDLELFLDLAWNIGSVDEKNVGEHYRRWLCRQFGDKAGNKLYPAMREFYRLCAQRRPEFMGWTQVELDKRLYNRGLSPVIPTEFNSKEFSNELDRYLDDYAKVAETVNDVETMITPELRDAYFAAIVYPVLAAEANAVKLLEAQRARENTTDADKMQTAVARCQNAYLTLRHLTEIYNNDISGGKWRGLMSMNPRNLPVYDMPSIPSLLSDTEVKSKLKSDKPAAYHEIDTNGTIARNASDFQSASEGVKTVDMLGHSMSAVTLPRDGRVTYSFTAEKEGDAVLRLALIPTQPNDNGDLRFSVSVDGGTPEVFTLKEPFRSENWKKNVLRGQALRELPVRLTEGEHQFTITALDPHIIVDQWMVDFKPGRKFYLFPIKNK